MGNFRACVEKDLSRVFLNPEEFGEIGEIAGHENVAMVVQNLELEMPPDAGDKREGVGYEGVTVFAKAADVPETLLAGKATSFRNEEWFILGASCEMGLKKIQLYREMA